MAKSRSGSLITIICFASWPRSHDHRDAAFFPGGDVGSLINVAGAAILQSSDQQDLALQLVDYLLSDSAQAYFAETTHEYPLVEAVEPTVDLPALADIEAPAIDLSDLADLQGTLEMIENSGALD